MCQIAGGAIGLGLNTAIVLSADTLRHGITIAFRVDAALALAGFAVAAGFVRGARTSPAHAAAPAGPPPGPGRAEGPAAGRAGWAAGWAARPGPARNCHYVRPGTPRRRARIGGQAPSGAADPERGDMEPTRNPHRRSHRC